jgi:hypothetical protein
VTIGGEGASGRGEKEVLDAGQLDHEFVDRGVDSRIIALRLPLITVDRLDGGPQPLTVRTPEGEGPSYTDCSDGIQLIGVEEDPSFQRGRFWARPEAMSRNGVGYCVNHLRWPTGQDLPDPLGSQGGMIRNRRPGFPAAYVVEQRRRSDDGQIGALSPPDALGQPQDAQYVIEIVDGVSTLIQTPRFGDRYHTPCSCFLRSSLIESSW